VSRRDQQQPAGLTPPKGTLNEARWTEILQAASAVFSEKGYDATTLQDIASRVGLLKGSLYYYIENKEDLMYQLAVRAHSEHLQGLRDDPGIAEGDAVSRMEHFIDRYMLQLDHNPPWNKVIERDFAFSGARSSSIGAVQHQTHLLLKGIITEGIAGGVFDPAIDVSVAVNGILSLMNSTTRWHRPTGRRSFREISEWYKRFIVHGLMTGEIPVGAGTNSATSLAD
jgi:AcrR family transcriptional regulator